MLLSPSFVTSSLFGRNIAAGTFFLHTIIVYLSCHVYLEMCVCVCVCVYIYIYTYIHTHTHTHTHTQIEIERGSTRSHYLKNSLWKRQWTCRKADYGKNV